MDDDGLVHLAEQPPPELMWGRYWYRSGTNASMTQELADIVRAVQRVGRVKARDVWVDIACNDGTLLRQIEGERFKIGVDPADGSFAREAARWCDAHYPVAFTSEVAGKIKAEHGPAQIVTCIAMFYDLMDPADFLAGVVDLLADDGLFVLQLSYTPLMLRQLAFDNICHEHARYYTLMTLTNTLLAHGLDVVDVQLNDTNGGSFRVFARKIGADPAGWATAPFRDVADVRVRSLWEWEMHAGVNMPAVWARFWHHLQGLRDDVTGFIRQQVAAGKSVWGYGASTKGNTLLQFFGLDHTLIEGIAERQEQKWGLRTVGTDIPIHSEKRMRATPPDFLLMLPWHFVAEFVERESRYLANGGRFIVPCPKFEVLGG
jgi:NDP-4-keto-2,6-dideoxyhexose 3-C-methyltransferase